MIRVKEGDLIPLILQAHDGRQDLDVNCVLKQLSDGKEYMRVKMTHLSDGLYVNNSVPMPVFKVAAQYIFAEKDRFADIDLYEPILKPEPEEKIIVGEVVGKSESNLIKGQVIKSEKKISNPK